MRGRALVTFLALLSSPALGQAPDERADRVLLLPLTAETSIDDEALVAAADQSLRTGAEEALGRRLKVESRARSARCVTSPRCVGKLAARARADRGVAFLLSPAEDDRFTLSYLVAERGGELLREGDRTLSRKELAAGARGAVVELLSPTALTGALVVPGVDEGAVVLVDGLVASAEDLAAGLEVTLGSHEVRVLRAEREPEVHEVEVHYGVASEVEIAPPPPEPEIVSVTTRPWWPAAVAAGVSVASLAVAGVFTADLAYAVVTTGAAAQDLPDGKVYPATVARQPTYLRARHAQSTDAAIIGLALATSGVAAAGAGALLAAWWLGDGAPPDEGER